jgi:hypothetical protein
VYLFVEFDVGRVVEDGQEVSLDGVRVGGLTQDFKQGRVRYKEEPWKQGSMTLFFF